MSEIEVTIYTCPMHPEVEEDRPGLCGECGMNLVKASEKSQHRGGCKKHKKSEGHDKHAGHGSGSMFIKKFWVAFVLTIPVFLYSELAERFFDFKAPDFPGSKYLSLVLGTIVFFYAGWIFLSSAARELKAKMPGMMTLIALAITVAYVYSVYVTFSGRGRTLFWELTSLIAVMLLGHWIEMRSVKGAQRALNELSKLLPDTAEVFKNGETKEIPISELRVGDIIISRPGGRIAADGVIVEGKSDIDESLITGESKPVSKEVNDEVVAGTGNGDGSLRIKVTKIGEDTFLSGVMRLVKDAQASKSKTQLLADKAAYWLTIMAVTTAIITFTAWILFEAGIATATERMVAVLVIACPHALGLAIPLVASISTTKAARSGFLVRERRALEAARNIDVVLFDKTGTLTKGAYGVDHVWAVSGKTEEDVLALAAAVDKHSEHFIAQAIVAETKKRNINVPESSDFKRVPGKGGTARVGGEEFFVGGAAMLKHTDAKVPDNIKGDLGEESKKEKTIIYVVGKKELIGVVALADEIRPESQEAVQALKELGVKTAMVTGDSEDVAEWVAEELEIDEYFARVLPGQKSEKVKELQKKGMRVAMVGDGINDAPALTQADIGVAIGAGTNVAIESAGIILVKDDPRDVVKIIKLSRMTFSKMIQNLFWAAGYNVAAIPLAAGVLISYGIVLQPAVAAIFMSLSTVIVAVNAVLLRGKALS